MAKKIKANTTAPVLTVAPIPPYQPRTPVSETSKKALYDEARSHWEDLCSYYGADDSLDMGLHVQKRMQAILGAVDLETATTALARSKAASLMAVLYLWAERRIPGPDRYLTWVRQAKRAETLAKMLDAKGQPDAAARQRQRAGEFWDKAEDKKAVAS